MNFVYSGSSTPTPSPRVQRKHNQGGAGYGRPLLPGYAQSSAMHVRTSSKEKKDVPGEAAESSLRDVIPAMRRPVAITCLVLNVLLPGLGTFVAGLTVFCGSVIRQKECSKQKVVCSNTLVAFLQLATAFLCLLGWIWSIVWGAAFLTISSTLLDVNTQNVVRSNTLVAFLQLATAFLCLLGWIWSIVCGTAFLAISNDYFKEFKRASMPVMKARSLDQQNGSDFNIMARTGSSPILATSTHLQKPIMLRSSSADQPNQPVILNLKAPISSRSESSLVSKKTHVDSRSRHQRYIKRPKSEDELAPFNLSHDRLEHIVIHNLPRAPARRGILRREDTITSTGSSVSEHENPYS